MIPSFIQRGLPRVLEFTLNRLLSWDADSLARLDELDGKRLHIHLERTHINFALIVKNQQLKVSTTDAETGHLNVHARAGDLAQNALNKLSGGAISRGHIDIAGDAHLAQQVQTLAKQYSPDMEAAIVSHFGSVLGVPMARFLRRMLEHLGDSATHAREDIASFVREDSGLSVSAPEMDMFLDEVDQLDARVNHMKRRVDRLTSQRPISS